MKILIASDLHGSLPATEKIIDAYRLSNANYLVLLGDLLNHGPRNPIPEGYAPAEVADILNAHARGIVAVRGNCDSEVDQMLLSFPILSDFAWLMLESGTRLFLTHGHIYNRNKLPPLSNGDVLVHGHTHIPVAESCQDIYVFNPGSPTFPRHEGGPSYGLYEERTLKVFDFTHQELKRLQI